jgi:ATP-binding cassette subfamily B protein
MSLPGPATTLFLNLGLVLIIWVGAKRVDSGAMLPGVILAFLTYFNMILMGVMGLNRIFMMLSKANASAHRIEQVLRQPGDLPRISEAEAARPEKSGQIVFDHVSFRYGGQPGENVGGEESRLSLEDISFTVQRGGRLGIIGPTGCGKTTLLNLLLRFYDATQGHIFVDGKDVRTYDKDDLRRRFGVVLQNDMIFEDTLGENIAFGRDVSDQAVRRAAEDARADEFIQEYEDQYRHRVAARGADLSGGQRQRLLIARALAADPEILILDDASSALDYRTDAALRHAIRTNHSGTTTIVVAQRVSSILDADEILVLDEGRILGRGTHAQLLESCGAYREIYKTQMGEGV